MFITKTMKVETGHIVRMFKLDIKHQADKKVVMEVPDQAGVLKKIASFIETANDNELVSIDVNNQFGEIQYMDGETKRYIQYEVKPD